MFAFICSALDLYLTHKYVLNNLNEFEALCKRDPACSSSPISHYFPTLTFPPEIIQCAQSLYCAFLCPSPRTLCPYLAALPFLPTEILLVLQEPSQMHSLPEAFTGLLTHHDFPPLKPRSTLFLSNGTGLSSFTSSCVVLSPPLDRKPLRAGWCLVHPWCP